MVETPDRSSLRPLVLVGVLLTGFTLRPAVTSVGALLPVLRGALPLGPVASGVLTAMPTLAFAVLGLAAVRIARRVGPERTIAAASVVIGAGLGVRALAGGATGFLAGSALALAGVAVTNVLGPPMVSRWFPDRAGPVSGLYAMSVAAGVALPAAVSVPLTETAGGWRAGLGVWAPVAVLAAIPWLRSGVRRRPVDPAPCGDAATSGPRRPVVLALTVFFGLQSLGGFVLMGWLPAIFVEAGVPGARAGVLLAATAALALPLALLVPVLADRAWLRPVLVLAVSGSTAAGWTGMLLAPAAAPWLWTALLAAAHGTYPLAVALVRVQAGDPAVELRLSGVVQTGGYALAAVGPLAVGVLQDLTAGWTVPLVVVIALTAAQGAVGLLAARAPRHRDGHSDDDRDGDRDGARDRVTACSPAVDRMAP